MPGLLSGRRAVLDPHPNVAAHFALASTQYATIADNAALSMGAGVRMSMCLWVQMASVAAGQVIAGKGRPVGGVAAFEYNFRYNTGTTKFNWIVSTGAATASLDLATPAVVPVGVWHFAVVTYDGANINASMNGAAFTSTAFSTDIQDGAFPFRLGASSSATEPFDGDLDCVGVWKRALTIAEVVQLYNGGKGMAYRDLSTALAASLVAWWDLDGDFLDRVGANTLTNTNGATFGAGKR